MSGAKVLKTIVLTAASQEHHTSVKIKSILRWLKTGHEVNVSIKGSADRQKNIERVMDEVERMTKSGADIKQKIVKPDSIKFNLRPTANAVNYVIDDKESIQDIDDIFEGKDLLSCEFEKELEDSIKSDKSRYKKK